MAYGDKVNPRGQNIFLSPVVIPNVKTKFVQLPDPLVGLNLSPGAGNVGKSVTALPRDAYVIKRLLLKVKGTVSITVAGTANPGRFAQKEFLQLAQFVRDGSDRFWACDGGMLDLWNHFSRGYRKNDVIANESFVSSFAVGSPTFEMTYSLDNHDPSTYPQLYSGLNVYAGAGVGTMNLELTFGNVTSFLTGGTATLTSLSFKLFAEVLDFSGLENYLATTEFIRFEPLVLQNLSLTGTTKQSFDLLPGLDFRGFMLAEMQSDGLTTQSPTGMTNFSVVVGTDDYRMQNIDYEQIITEVESRYNTTVFQDSNYNEAVFLDLANNREASQSIKTTVNGLVVPQFKVFVDNTVTTNKLNILELRYRIPPLALPPQQGGLGRIKHPLAGIAS